MRLVLLLVVLLTAAAFAGCTNDTKTATPTGGASTNFITPDAWRVSADTDRILVWAHNEGTTNVKGTFSLTLAGNAPLPTGWNVTFQTPSFDLKPVGTKETGARGKTYPDWAWTLLTIKVPADAPAGTNDVVLHAGAMEHAAKLEIVSPREAKVSGPGSKVTVAYKGTFSDGTAFDDGEFPTTLGSGQTVAGFDYGLMGLGLHEKAKIVIPPAMGYGYDNPAGSYAKFNGQTLIFDVEVKALA